VLLLLGVARELAVRLAREIERAAAVAWRRP
jgi:hypothetical protein